MMRVMFAGVGDRRVRDGALSGAIRAAAAAVAILALAASSWAQELNGDIQELARRARLGSAKVGVSVVDADTGRVLGRLRLNAPSDGAGGATFLPASNMKLLTSGAALLVLGPDFEFRTRVYRAGSRLVIEGAGDPALADPELLEKEMRLDVEQFVDRIVQSVTAAAAQSGAAAFTEVVIDDRVFDRDYVRAEWPQDQALKWYCAEVSGLNFFTNVLRIYATPGEQEGVAPRLRWEPSAAGIDVVNRARTVKKTDANTLGFGREVDRNSFLVRGSVRAAGSTVDLVNTHEPGLILASMVAQRLAAAGQGTGPDGRAAPAYRLVGPDESLGAPERTYVVIRTPMETVLARCNRDSHNLYAECLLKRAGNAVTGQPGSWTNGAAVVRMQVRDRLGPEAAASLLVADGSGLSRGNGVTPELFTSWLSVMHRDAKASEAFVSSLPAIGDGTLEKRFRGKKLASEVRAKSGYIDGVRTLSGYVTHKAGGKRIAFSILVNDIPPSVPGVRVKEFHEDVVEAIDKWLAAHVRVEAEAIGG